MKTALIVALTIAGVYLVQAIEPPVVPPPPGEIVEIKFQYKRSLTDPTWQTVHTMYSAADTGFFRTVIK
jgi:hypothetical protein